MNTLWKVLVVAAYLASPVARAEETTPSVETWQSLQSKAMSLYTSDHTKWSESVALLGQAIGKARASENNSVVVRMHLNAAGILWNEGQKVSAVAAIACAYKLTNVAPEYRIATLIAYSYYERQLSGYSMMSNLWDARSLAQSSDNWWALVDIQMRVAERDLDFLDFARAHQTLKEAAVFIERARAPEYHGYPKAYWAMRLKLQAFWLCLAQHVVFGLHSERDEIASLYYDLSHDAEVVRWKTDPDVSFVLDYARVWFGQDDVPVKLDPEEWEKAIWWMALQSPHVGRVVPAAPPHIVSLPLWQALFLRAGLTPVSP